MFRRCLFVPVLFALAMAMPTTALAGWGTPATLNDAPGEFRGTDIQVVSLNDGRSVAAWQTYDEATADSEILAAIRAADGGWGMATVIATSSSTNPHWGGIVGFDLATDGGRALIAYTVKSDADGSYDLSARFLPDGSSTWGSSQSVDELATDISAIPAPVAVLAPDGTAAIASIIETPGAGGARGVVFARQDDGASSWTTERPFVPEVAADPDHTDDIRIHDPGSSGFDLGVTTVSGNARYTVAWATIDAGGTANGLSGDDDHMELHAATSTASGGVVPAFGAGTVLRDGDDGVDAQFGATFRELKVAAAGGDTLVFWTFQAAAEGSSGKLEYAARESAGGSFGSVVSLGDYRTSEPIVAGGNEGSGEVLVLNRAEVFSPVSYKLLTWDAATNTFGTPVANAFELAGGLSEIRIATAVDGSTVFSAVNSSDPTELVERLRASDGEFGPHVRVVAGNANYAPGSRGVSVAGGVGDRFYVFSPQYGSPVRGVHVVDRSGTTAVESASATVDERDVELVVTATPGATISINWGDMTAPSTGAPGTFTHTYASNNTYNVLVTATNGPDVEVSPQYVVVNSVANVLPTHPTSANGHGFTPNVPRNTRDIQLTLSGAADTDGTIAGYSIHVDQLPGTVPDATVDSASATFSRTFDSGGSWYVHVRAVDDDGAAGTGALHLGPYIVDTTGPAAPTVGGVPAAPTTATSLTFTLASEAGATFQCSAGDSPFASCTSPVALTGLVVGTHTFRVIPTDALGNQGTMTTVTWTIIAPQPPKNPPLAQITLPAGAPAKLGAIAKSGVLPLQLPKTIEAGTTVKANLVLTAAQAKALGIKVPKGAKTVIIGTGSLTTPKSRAVATQTLKIKLTKAAKAAFAKAAKKGSKVKAVKTTVGLTLSKNGVSAKPINKPFTLKP